MGRPRVLLADDHVSLMDAFRKLLEPEFEAVGTVSDAQALLVAAWQFQPDLIVVDIGLLFLNGMEAGRKLKKLLPRTRLLMVAMNEDASVAVDALREWEAGFLLRKSAGAELIYAIHELVPGKAFVAPTVPQPLEPEFKHPGVQSDKILTRRQREVLQLLAGGLTMKETATTLKLTPRTIAFHKYKIIQDFGLHNNLDLLKLAIREHLVTPE